MPPEFPKRLVATAREARMIAGKGDGIIFYGGK
jgi:hypothetical protein